MRWLPQEMCCLYLHLGGLRCVHSGASSNASNSAMRLRWSLNHLTRGKGLQDETALGVGELAYRSAGDPFHHAQPALPGAHPDVRALCGGNLAAGKDGYPQTVCIMEISCLDHHAGYHLQYT